MGYDTCNRFVTSELAPPWTAVSGDNKADVRSLSAAMTTAWTAAEREP